MNLFFNKQQCQIFKINNWNQSNTYTGWANDPGCYYQFNANSQFDANYTYITRNFPGLDLTSFRFHNLIKWPFCSVLCFWYINSKQQQTWAVKLRVSNFNGLSLSTPFHFRFHNLIKWPFCSVLCFRYINSKQNVCNSPLIFISDFKISKNDHSVLYCVSDILLAKKMSVTLLSLFYQLKSAVLLGLSNFNSLSLSTPFHFRFHNLI